MSDCSIPEDLSHFDLIENQCGRCMVSLQLAVN